METAKAVLAPGDPGFYKKMGFYGGSHVRALPVGIAVSEQTRALRLYGMLWRTFFDAGDLEVIEACAEGAILRIRDFPAAPPFCHPPLGLRPMGRTARRRARRRVLSIIVGIGAAVLIASALVLVFDRWQR